MITTKQLHILGQLVRRKTVSEIKHALQIKSQSLVPTYLATLEKKDLIRKTKVANAYLYEINPRNPLVFSYIELFNIETLPKEPKKILFDILTKTFSPVLIFGSYAKKTYTTHSDLDIAIISSHTELYKELEELELKSLLKLDIHIISKDAFREMLASTEENLGKEIARNYLAVTGYREIYSLVKEGQGVNKDIL